MVKDGPKLVVVIQPRLGEEAPESSTVLEALLEDLCLSGTPTLLVPSMDAAGQHDWRWNDWVMYPHDKDSSGWSRKILHQYKSSAPSEYDLDLQWKLPTIFHCALDVEPALTIVLFDDGCSPGFWRRLRSFANVIRSLSSCVVDLQYPHARLDYRIERYFGRFFYYPRDRPEVLYFLKRDADDWQASGGDGGTPVVSPGSPHPDPLSELFFDFPQVTGIPAERHLDIPDTTGSTGPAAGAAPENLDFNAPASPASPPSTPAPAGPVTEGMDFPVPAPATAPAPARPASKDINFIPPFPSKPAPHTPAESDFSEDEKTFQIPEPAETRTPVTETESAPAKAASPAREVQLAVSTPQRVEPGECFVARFGAYTNASRHEILRRFELEAPGAQHRMGLESCRWRRGARVTVRLQAEGADVVTPVQRFNWNGHCQILRFDVHVHSNARGPTLILKFDIAVEGLPILALRPEIKLGGVFSTTAVSAAHTLTEAAAPRTAFASYARSDRREVLGRVRSLQLFTGIDVFLDCLSLYPGEIWKTKLDTEIRSREIFWLFWSRHAMASEWVEWEWRTALDVKSLTGIQPHPLEPAEVAPPPTELSALQFGGLYEWCCLQQRESWWSRQWRRLRRCLGNF